MSCNKCKKSRCGCKDAALTTQAGCTTNPACDNGDPCPETFSAQCVVYNGNSLPDLGIVYGDRLDVIIQRLGLFILNPGCITPGSGCQSALGVKTSTIGSTNATIKWEAFDLATEYQVEYKLASATSWTLNTPAITPTTGQEVYTDYIGGLAPNSLYYVRVKTTCPAGICYSLIISFTTLP
jgi:hypothetical protein